MNWSKGFSASCYVKTVDPDSWRDVDKLDIYGGSVKRSDGDLAEAASPLLR